MLAPNDARITALRCLDAAGGGAGAIAAGDALEAVMSVEAGASLFATGGRFAAGIQIDGVAGPFARVDGWLAGADWPSPAAELRFRIPGPATSALVDRLLGVAGFLRVNAAPPYLVSTVRGPDVFVAPTARG